MAFTTYAFPEIDESRMPPAGIRLIFLVPGPLTPDESQLLQRIAGALQTDMERDVHLMIHNDEAPCVLPSSAGHTPMLVLGFGIEPEAVGIWIDLQGPGMCRLEQMTYIRTITPARLLNDAAAKKNLWQQIQVFLDRREIHSR